MLALLLIACTSTSKTSADTADSEDTGALLSPDCEVVGDRPAGWTNAGHDDETDPDYDLVFDRGSVLEVDITVSAEDHAAMYAELEELLGGALGEGGGGGPPDGGGGPPDDTGGAPPEGGGDPLDVVSGDPSYVEATVQVGDLTWCHVGMRYKGNSTLQQTWAAGIQKLPFRLDFDHYEDDHPEVDDQRFYGFKELSFGNNMADPTYIRDVMASVILEDRGVPAARNRFVAVTLDVGDGPTYLGLYTLNEDPSDALLDRLWGDDEGALYEGDGDCADLTCYDAESFEAKKNEDIALGAEIEALVAALSLDGADGWQEQLDGTIDVDGFLRWLAVNSAIENWDAYGAMSHNYYLYADPDDGGRLAWIPWDHNMSLMDGLMGSTDPLLADVDEEWPLIRLTLDDPTWAATYRAYLAEALEGAYEVETFEANAEAWRALLEPYVVGDQGEREGYTFVGDEATWDAAYEDLYEHVESRRAEVEAALQ